MPDRSRPSHPLRLLAVLVGGALAVLAALTGRATADGWPLPTVVTTEAPADLRQPHLARADTDTVKTRADSLALDSLALDSLALDSLALDSLTADSVTADSVTWADTGRAALYLPSWRLRSPLSAPFPHRRGPLLPPLGRYWQTQVLLDSTRLQYVARERVGELEVRRPLILTYDAFRLERLRKDLDDTWRELTLQRERARESKQAGGGLGFNIVVPGGRQSAFTTIFGKPDVSLRVTGQADIKAGFNYRKSDQQATLTGDATQVDPDFKQDLRLGITGGIGDKMRVDVNYDTQNQFDFQNQLKLQYTGYEDEIIQKIEAGNVFLQTPSQLIRGGQSLFGIKSELQIGGVRLTTVMSQEEGQANTKSIDGGAEAQTFEFRPTGYDEARHFFLSYFFRNRFEDALSDPPQIRVLGGFERITEVEVWKLPNAPLPPEELNARQVVAIIDLGENADSLRKADGFITASTLTLPDNVADRYTDGPGGDVETLLREGTVTPNDYLESLGMTAADFQVGRFKKLLPFTDYTFDPILGTISLKQRLQDNEALGLAFRYTYNGRTRQVGDFSTDTGGSSGGQNEDRLVLKLIRPQQLRPPAPEIDFNPAAWYLELRNIYQVQGRNINANEFELQIDYEPPGQTASPTLPGVGGQQTLVQLLGLDRLNADGAPRPDERFDYLSGITIDPDEGLIIFPYLQPFGSHLARLIDETAPEDQRADLQNLYVFRSLYTAKKVNAQRETQFDVFRVHGSYKGAAEAFYDLQAFSGVVPGSVRVTSGGNALQEGADYVVDYQAGTVSITNPSYLTAGRNVEISYEQNSFFNLQKKTLLGARADYKLDERLSLGATLMRLSQKSPIDKFRLGEEPIQNTIWGLDGALLLEPRWLTQAVDALPLLQTRANSLLRFTGEFAQFRPGNTQTVAFERTQRDLRRDGRNFNPDEQQGISYLDDFEGFENTFSFLSPGFWGLSPAPDSIGAVDPVGVMTGGPSDSLRTNWRASLAWYQLNANITEELANAGAVLDPRFADAIQIVEINDVFPDRDTRAETDTRIQTFDLHFSPFERGPYNYSTRLQDFFANPHLTWGGIMQRVPEGYNDFSQKNIDFVEFVFKPFPENDARDAGEDARLYVDLGAISEDILPNKRPNPNNEDGLSLTSIEPGDLDTWGRLPKGSINGLVDIDEATKRTEDLGLDGLPSHSGDYPAFATEQAHFAHFLNALGTVQSTDPRIQAEIAKAQADPSGDDYYNFTSDYFNNRQFFPNGATAQQRMSHYFPGHELNSYESQTQIAGGGRGNSRTPDTEDRNLNSTVDQDNSFFQYEIPLGRRALKDLSRPEEVDDYVVGEIVSSNGDSTGWYLIRIPVQQYTRRTGSIQDFTSIQYMRLWTTGHRVPITMRFATLEFVGSQWQKSDRIALEGRTASDTLAEATRLTISSINNEENSDLYLTPNGTIISQTRLATGRPQNAREQALVLRVEDLRPGRQRGIFKPQNALDLLKYSNLRMFTHLHGFLGDGTDLTTLPKEVAREHVRLFVRLGSSETNDYYEYEQPLTPSPENAGDPDVLWQTNQEFGGQIIDLNSVNIELAALNQLKTTRDRLAASDPQNVRTDQIFWNVNADTLVSPDAPDAERFAPPGTRLGIKGNPSLQKVNSIVIGIRNGADSTSTAFGDILEDVTVWVNELRVAGYDASTGWAGLANLNLKLADFIDLKANFQAQTDGFGSLSSTLGDRDQKTLRNWSVNGEFYLDKFIPERFGWQLPVSVQVQSNTTTPRFSPTRGDVRLDDLLAQIDERSDLTAPERTVLKNEAIESAQTLSQTRSLTTRMSKQGSRSRLLRNTLDGVTASYSLTQSDARNPSQSINDSWRWVANVGYRFSARKPRTLRPFWFLGGVPVASLLGDLRFNYLPQSITTGGSATRNLTTTQNRAVPTTTPTNSLTRPLPDLVRYPIRETHQFTHARNFGLQYSPFGFLNLSFDTDTNQSLNAAGADTTFTVARFDTTGGTYTLRDLLPGLRFRDAVAQGLVTPQDSAVTAFELTRLSLLPGGQVLNTLFSGGDGLRTERYQQRFTGTFSPRLNRIRALNWFNLQDISYGVQYQWDNGAVGRNTGADISNQIDVRGGLTLRPQEFWRKFGFYRNLEDAQRRIDQEKQAKRQRKEDERRRRKAAREQEQNPETQPQPPSEGQLNPNLPDNRRPPTAVPPRQEAPEDQEEKPPPEEEEEIPEEFLDEEQPDEDVGDEAEDAPDEDERPTPPSDSKQQGGGGLKLPLPSPKGLLRRTVLAVTGIRDLSLTYSGTRGASSSNVGRPLFNNNGQLRGVETSYTLLDAFKGKGPSVRYRFGLEREVGVESRILDQTLQVADVLNNADRFQGRTSLNPSQSLTITLNWSLDRSTGRNLTFRPPDDPDAFGIDTTLTENGTNKASVWAFGASYLDLFQQQFDTYRRDLARAPIPDPLQLGDEDGNGRVVATNPTVVDDFRQAFLSGRSTLDGRNLLPFPLPSWTVSYAGLGKWPLLRRLVQNATLRHSYSADYSNDFATNTIAEAGAIASFPLGATQIEYLAPRYVTNSVRLNERYQPFLGVDLTWKGNLQTNVSWNRSNTWSLSASNLEVSENKTNDLSATVNFQKTGLKLPFIRNKLQNRASIGLTVTRSQTSDQRYLLKRALEQAAINPDFVPADALTGDNILRVTGHTRLTLQPQVSYQFSNRVSANFTLKYEQFNSEDNRQPSATNVQGTFNIRISIQN